MQIIKENNKIFFNEDNTTLANISVTKDDDKVFLELIKVDQKCRRRKCATKMMYKMLDYLKSHNYKRISLSPLPLDNNGISLENLIAFYKYFGFKKSINANRTYPYLMDMSL